MGSLSIDPNLVLAKAVLGFTLLLCIYQLIIHGLKGIYWVYTRFEGNAEKTKIDACLNAFSKREDKDDENISFFNYLRTSYFNSLLRWLLALLYIRSITLAISITDAVFGRNVYRLHYSTTFTDFFAIQFAVICIAGFLWYRASYWVKRFVYCGLIIVAAKVVLTISV
jgi:hypothetical protein